MAYHRVEVRNLSLFHLGQVFRGTNFAMSSVFRRTLDVLRANFEARLSTWETRAEERQQRSDRGEDSNPSEGRDAHRTGVDPDLARYYSNLEVPYGSDLETVRESWKRLVRKYHPDLHGVDPERQAVATELVKGLNHAFEEIRTHLKHTT